MPKIEVVDEAVINASPQVVYKAIIEEYAGVTHWFMPLLEFKHRTDTPVGVEGMTIDLLVHDAARPRFYETFSKVVEGKSIDIEIGGDFAGSGKWTFEPVEGKTKLTLRWDADPKRLSFILLSPFIDIGKRHSKIIQTGFVSLNNYLSKN